MSLEFNKEGYSLKAYDAPEDEVIEVCAVCLSPDAHEVHAGDEGWTVCESCRSVEQGYCYIHESEVDEV